MEKLMNMKINNNSFPTRNEDRSFFDSSFNTLQQLFIEKYHMNIDFISHPRVKRLTDIFVNSLDKFNKNRKIKISPDYIISLFFTCNLYTKSSFIVTLIDFEDKEADTDIREYTYTFDSNHILTLTYRHLSDEEEQIEERITTYDTLDKKISETFFSSKELEVRDELFL